MLNASDDTKFVPIRAPSSSPTLTRRSAAATAVLHLERSNFAQDTLRGACRPPHPLRSDIVTRRSLRRSRDRRVQPDVLRLRGDGGPLLSSLFLLLSFPSLFSLLPPLPAAAVRGLAGEIVKRRRRGFRVGWPVRRRRRSRAASGDRRITRRICVGDRKDRRRVSCVKGVLATAGWGSVGVFGASTVRCRA